jgi:hypothetical protein
VSGIFDFVSDTFSAGKTKSCNPDEARSIPTTHAEPDSLTVGESPLPPPKYVRQRSMRQPFEQALFQQPNFTCKLTTINASELSQYSALPRGTRGKEMFGYCCHPQAPLFIYTGHSLHSFKNKGEMSGNSDRGLCSTIQFKRYIITCIILY